MEALSPFPVEQIKPYFLNRFILKNLPSSTEDKIQTSFANQRVYSGHSENVYGMTVEQKKFDGQAAEWIFF